MITKLNVREHNKAVYEELFKDMQNQRNGLFSFVLRISAQEIVDYVIMDNIPPEAFSDEPTIAPIHR